MDVSIVIVNYNSFDYLKACVASIIKTTESKYEVIVVDNASEDGGACRIEGELKQVKLIRNKKNVGFARANNQGFLIAAGKYFLMLNPDTVILDQAIDKLIHFMAQHADIAVCGPRNISAEYMLQNNCDHFPSIWNEISNYLGLGILFPIKLFKRTHMRYWDFSDIRDVDKITGCSLMIRADDYRNHKGLDEKYFMYFEETDFCFRIKRSGKRVVFYPHAQIIHYGGGSSEERTTKVYYKTVMPHYLTSKYYFFEKNYGPIHSIGIRFVDMVYGVLLILKSKLRNNIVDYDFGRLLVKHAISRGAQE